MEERRSARRARHPHSALQTPQGEPVTVVHLAAEYYPYARSGGLAEAVANLARYQSAEGTRSLALLPLYRSAREAAGPLVPPGGPVPVRRHGRRRVPPLPLSRPAGGGAAPLVPLGGPVQVRRNGRVDEARLLWQRDSRPG